MAIELKLEVTTQNCNYISVKDITGIYANPGNLTGWDDSNLSGNTVLKRSNVTSAIIELILVSTGVALYTWDVEALILTQSGLSDPLILLKQNLTIPDGIYYLRLTVGGTVNGVAKTFTVDYKQWFYCTVNCCVMQSRVALESVLCNPCDTSEISAMRMKQDLIDTMQAAECLGDDCAFNNALARLQRMCNSGESYSVSPCNCGN